MPACGMRRSMPARVMYLNISGDAFRNRSARARAAGKIGRALQGAEEGVTEDKITREIGREDLDSNQRLVGRKVFGNVVRKGDSTLPRDPQRVRDGAIARKPKAARPPSCQSSDRTRWRIVPPGHGKNQKPVISPLAMTGRRVSAMISV